MPTGRTQLHWLFLSIALTTFVAALDAAVGPEAVLVGLLAAGPLVAAIRLGPKATALVAAYAVALAILAGVWDDVFAKEDHWSRLLVVVVAAVIGVWMARLRQRQEQAAQRLAAQHAVARLLNESESLEAATPAILRSIGETLGWELGALWQVDREARVLRLVESWQARGADFEEFRRINEDVTFERGVGLPGRVWERGEAAWVSDLANESFPRAGAAAEAGLKAWFAFPIRTGRGPYGVVEFFSATVTRPNAELLDMVATFGGQIGAYLERREAEHSVRASEALKTGILNSAFDCVITIDERGRVLEFNPAAETTFGYTRDEALGREMASLIIPAEYRDRHRQGLAHYRATGEGPILDRRLELAGMRADGSVFPAELAITRVGTDSPPRFTGYLRDITARKSAQAELQRSRDELKAILEGIADGVTAMSPDGELVYANSAAVEVLRFSSAEALLATPVRELMEKFEIFGEDGEPFDPRELPGRLALSGEPAEPVTVRFRVRATGEERWSVVKSTPIFDDHGDVVLVINIFEDVTEQRREEEAQRFLADASVLLSGSLDLHETLERLATLVIDRAADWCAIDLLRPDGGAERVTVAHADPDRVALLEEFQERYPPRPDDPGVKQVLRTGESQLFAEIGDDLLRAVAQDDEHLALIRSIGLTSGMVVPLVARGRVLGALSLAMSSQRRRFDHEDLAMAQELGVRAGVAVDNARLFSELGHTARTLQESLLPPHLPAVPGVETAARFHAAGEGNEVGGDFYDLFDTGEAGWAVVIGDVCGKGADAAAVTALARYTLRAAGMRESRPSRALELLNEAMLRQRSDMRFCSVAYLMLKGDEHGATVCVSSGGHPLPLLLHADGSVEEAGLPGTLLGVLPDPELLDKEVLLLPGDTLVLYTDGVTEVRAQEEELFGPEHLEQLLRSSAGLTADAIADRIERVVLEAQGHRPRDDIAILVIRVPERASRGVERLDVEAAPA